MRNDPASVILAENLHRCDLTKEQRDEHIRRYAELLEARRVQNGLKVQIESKREDGRGHRHKSVATEIAEQTGLSRKTIDRAIKRQSQASPPVDELTDAEVVDRQVNAVMNAWNRASPEARAIIRDLIDIPTMDTRHAG